jgi:beta-glucosidase
MASYNRLYGLPACASTPLLEDLLRREWGFKGFVVSDCWALSDIYLRHKVVKTPEEAAAMALKAGCDLECGSEVYGSLGSAVAQGLVRESLLDRSLARVFEARIRLGMFDPPGLVPYERIPAEMNGAPAHAALALEVARESMALLVNRGLLPLDRAKLRRVAVIGPNADTVEALVGNYAGHPRVAPTLVEALRTKLGARVEVTAIRGIDHVGTTGRFTPVPDLCLDSEGGAGLRAEHYANTRLEGKPALVRQDLGVNFHYDLEDGTAPLGLPRAGNSSRWSGVVAAPAEGAYTPALRSPNAVRLWLDDRLAVDQWSEADPKAPARPDATVRLDLRKGQRVSLRLEHMHGANGPSRCALLWDRKDLDLTETILARAKGADVVIFAGGLTGELEGEEGAGGEELEGLKGGDRTRIELPAAQTALMKRLHEASLPVVFVNLSGSPMAMPWEAANLPAILQAWYPGQAGSQAIADALFGDINPAGRLPLTFYRATTDLPDLADYRMENRTYRFFKGEPLFPFGHGLSYTRFTYGPLKVSRTTVGADGTVEVSLTLRNAGTRAGEEVVQLYVRQLDPAVPMARRDLRAFRRVAVPKGAEVRVRLAFKASELRRWDDVNHRWVVDPGAYEIQVGASSADIRQRRVIRVRAGA